MSVSGNMAMALLRLVKPGKGSFADLEKSRKRAVKENAAGRFQMPTDKKADYTLVPDTEFPCLLIRSRKRKEANENKAILFLYGEEVLADNAPAYRRAFERDGAGGKLHIEVVKNMMHGYSCMPVFPESKKAYFETIRLIKEL